ncbi:hypothetical protein KUCAC02_006268 [Chaenocephalus aceratus]|uniref:Uncharacterized protein n=1 Tax=Chaenocephalus aceratus TaxID=36190 RepID=A0ACB9VRE6_CHAAC|nr:hypothetical protein KUCAC02_006268 [Chaenocephalus aceratus]
MEWKRNKHGMEKMEEEKQRQADIKVEKEEIVAVLALGMVLTYDIHVSLRQLLKVPLEQIYRYGTEHNPHMLSGIVRKKQWCEMVPCLEDEGCDLLVNKSGWTCTQPGGRVKTTTTNTNTQTRRSYTLCVNKVYQSASVPLNVSLDPNCCSDIADGARSSEHVRPVRQVFVRKHQRRQTDISLGAFD